MADERMARDSAALDEATDHVIREMTHVHLSDDTGARVMARLRVVRGTASGAAGHRRGRAATDVKNGSAWPAGRGWRGALLDRRFSWTTVAAAAALAAILAAAAAVG